jgi:uncharacterized membrane protein
MEDEITGEQAGETGESQIPTTPEAGDETPAPKTGFDKRISELTRKRREAERDAAYWRGRAEAATIQPSAPPAPKVTELDPNDFNSDAEYLKAVAKKVADDTRAAIREEMREAPKSVAPIIIASREKYDDFDEVAFDPALPVTQSMYDAAVGDNLGEVLYHLGKNPKEAARIAGMTPVQQVKEIGKIETILTLKPTKKTTNAPVPPTVVSGNSSPPRKAEADMKRSELYALWEQQRRKEAGLK